MKNIDILRYSHDLPNGEVLSISIAFNQDLENEESYLERCKLMYRAMKNTIQQQTEYKMSYKTGHMKWEGNR